MSLDTFDEQQLPRRVAASVRRKRAAAGLTQDELAEAAGIDTRHLQKIEAAEVNLTLRTLGRLALALGADPVELVRGDA